MTIRVVIADDHAFTLDGLQRALEAAGGFEVLATARTGIEAIALARRHQPDLVLLDHVMPDVNGTEALPEIRQRAPAARVAILTGTSDTPTLRHIAAAGADGIFSKGENPAAITAGLRRVAAGETVIGKGFAHLQPAEPGSDVPLLSPREGEVLAGVAQGMTNARIADLLAISPKTVETHRARILRKLEANSTATMLIRAIQEGLIEY